MFEHMRQINKLVNKKINDIESAVTKSEAIFVENINLLIKNKAEISKQERKLHILPSVKAWLNYLLILPTKTSLFNLLKIYLQEDYFQKKANL